MNTKSLNRLRRSQHEVLFDTFSFKKKYYINFVAASRASATLSERGVGTLPLVADWGALGTVAEVSASEFQRNSMRLFGYSFDAPALKPLREAFRNLRVCYLYRLGTGGARAENDYGTAKYPGTRGNVITVTVRENVDGRKDVTVLLDGAVVAAQTVSAAAELVDDDYVDYNKAGALPLTAGSPMTGGEDPAVTSADFQTYLDRIEGYAFHVIGCPSDDNAVKALFTAFTKRLRDEQGVKFQCVTFDHAADYEGVVNVRNTVTDDGAEPYALVYWVTGVVGGTAVNQSAMNKTYDGEYAVQADFTQAQLEAAIRAGRFVLHRNGVGGDVCVLRDINSLVTVTAEKGEIFKENQTIRVIDQIANDIAVLFRTRYLGIVPNDTTGRISLWADLVEHHRRLQEIRAIEGFQSEDVTVEPGDNPRSVVVRDRITVVNAMAQLYMTVTVL